MDTRLLAVLAAVLLLSGAAYCLVQDRDGDGETVSGADYAAVVCDPAMGAVTLTAYEYPHATYKAQALAGYTFLRWTAEDGSVLTTDASYTVDLTSRTTVTAVFAAASLTQSFAYQLPVSFAADAVATVQRTLTITVSSADYAASMAANTVRHAETAVRTPAYMVDPDDAGVQAVASALTAATAGYSDLERLTAALYWVQTAIDYAYDSGLYGQAEWWAYPSECLYNDAGDCEDTAVLFCSLAEALGYQTALIAFDGHMGAAAVIGGVTGGQTYTAGGVTYTYCETAVDTPCGVGVIAASLASAACTVVPIVSGVETQ